MTGVVLYGADSGLPTLNPVWSIAEDRSGHVWVGFYEGGIAHARAGRFEYFDARDGVPAGGITAIHADAAGRLWVGSSQGGLGRLDDPERERLRFTTYTPSNGLSSAIVSCIAEDSQGRIYVGAGPGIDRLDPESGRVRRFTMGDGLAGTEALTALRDADSHLWFGTTDGISRLTEQSDEEQSPPPVAISGVRVVGDPLDVSPLGELEITDLEFPHNRNRIEIDFLGLSFRTGEVLKYQYQLQDVERDWTTPATDRRVTFANLSPGSYRFQVRAIRADGLVSARPAVVSFTILPPFWQRWWFIALAGLAVGTIARGVYRARVARFVELERVRTRIAADLHDDIGATLSRMAILSEVVKREVAVQSENATRRLNEIADSARQLTASMSDIVWAVDPARDDLTSLIARVRQFAGEVLEARRIGWTFDVPDEPDGIELSPELRREVLLVFKEALNNAVRHAGCRTVQLSIRLVHRALVAEIRDDGSGVTEPASDPATAGGRGLRNMRERAERLGGRLDLVSAPGEGTRVTMTLPMNGPA